MNKTKIEWADYTINPVKGLCPMACSYCYARAMYKRFKWNPEIRYDHYALPELENLKSPSRIFVGSTIELFGDWIAPWWHEDIFDKVRYFKQHTFIFLTKKPQNLIKWSPFPDNCWIGVSATNTAMALEAWEGLADIEATMRFISFEPLQERILMKDFTVLDWAIIGRQTPPNDSTCPKVEWIKEIVDAADKYSIPVFLKDNLHSLLAGVDFTAKLRQQFPSK